MYIRNATGLLTCDVLTVAPSRLPAVVTTLMKNIAYSCGAVADSHRFPEHRVAITEAHNPAPPKELRDSFRLSQRSRNAHRMGIWPVS